MITRRPATVRTVRDGSIGFRTVRRQDAHAACRSVAVRRRSPRRVTRVGVAGARGARGSLRHVRFRRRRVPRDLADREEGGEDADGDGAGGNARTAAQSARGFAVIGNERRRRALRSGTRTCGACPCAPGGGDAVGSVRATVRGRLDAEEHRLLVRGAEGGASAGFWGVTRDGAGRGRRVRRRRRRGVRGKGRWTAGSSRVHVARDARRRLLEVSQV